MAEPWPDPKFLTVIPLFDEPEDDIWYLEYPAHISGLIVAATRRADRVQRLQKIHEHTKDARCVADKTGRARYSHRVITPLLRGEDG